MNRKEEEGSAVNDAALFSRTPKEETARRPGRPFALLTALTCGAAVMVLEVLGARVLGPYFGVSLFVWSAMIAVTMIALAFGYALGGILADRQRSLDGLFALLGLGALWVLLIPLIKTPVLVASTGAGLRIGALVSAAVLFALPLFLLGCASPALIRFCTRSVGNVGRTVGLFYAVSTAGSVAGTLLTGFFLITWLGIAPIFVLTAMALLALCLYYFLGCRRFKGALLLPLLLALPLLYPAQAPEARLPGEIEVTVVESRESLYGNIKVLDYRKGEGHYRDLLLDGASQSIIDAKTGQSVSPYYDLLGILARAVNPDGKRALVLGAGAGVIPRWFEREGILVDVVDIDAEMIEVAREHFGYRPTGTVHIADARAHLRDSRRSYDYLILDVFSGEFTPAHLLSLEAIRAMKKRLDPSGVLALNLIAQTSGDTFVLESIVRTLNEAFEQVELYPLHDPSRERFGNIAVLAYDGASVPVDSGAAAPYPVHPAILPDVRRALENRYHLPHSENAIVLTDAYNPVDTRDLELKEFSREVILQTVPLRILAY